MKRICENTSPLCLLPANQAHLDLTIYASHCTFSESLLLRRLHKHLKTREKSDNFLTSTSTLAACDHVGMVLAKILPCNASCKVTPKQSVLNELPDSLPARVVSS